MNRGDIKLAYDRAIAHDVPDVADRLLEMAERISALEARNAVLWGALNGLLQDDGAIAFFAPMNVAKAYEALASTPEQSLADIRRAERERCAKACEKEATEAFAEGVEDWGRSAAMCAAAIRYMED